MVNDVSDRSIGFNSRDNEVTLIHEGGDIHFGKQSKSAIAQQLMEQLVEIFAAKIER